MGYGRMGVNIARQLRRMGIEVYDHLTGQKDYGAKEFEGNSARCNLAVWASTPSQAKGWWTGQHVGILTMWEATRLPESFRENLHEFDTVMVPSFHNVELFSQYHDNVHFIPLGFDPEVWNYAPAPEVRNEFRFLIGGSGPRKGTDLAYKAFKRVFQTWPNDGPVPVLVMKNPRAEDFYGDRIRMVTGKISAQEERDLYVDSHCYLQPSRGEGFGLQPLQAIATGRPTILTAAHGHDSFAHLGFGLNHTLSPAAYFSHGHAGEWWEPNFEQLCDYMEYVYNNYEEASALAEKNAELAKEFTWKRTAERMVDLLGGYMGPYEGPEIWHEPEIKLYRVRVNKPWQADIAGIQYLMEPGRDYWEPADVKRHLFDGGVLDPECLTETLPDGTVIADRGLNKEQAAKIPAYTASHAYCPTCHQRYNSQPTRGDDLLEAMKDVPYGSAFKRQAS